MSKCRLGPVIYRYERFQRRKPNTLS